MALGRSTCRALLMAACCAMLVLFFFNHFSLLGRTQVRPATPIAQQQRRHRRTVEPAPPLPLLSNGTSFELESLLHDDVDDDNNNGGQERDSDALRALLGRRGAALRAAAAARAAADGALERAQVDLRKAELAEMDAKVQLAEDALRFCKWGKDGIKKKI